MLIGLAILAALGVGYATVALTSAPAPQAPTVVIPPLSSSASADDTTVAASIPTRTPLPTLTAIAASSPAPRSTTIAEASPSDTEVPPDQVDTAVAEEPDVFINETFDGGEGTSGFPTQQTDTWSAEVVDQRYQLTLNGQTFIGFSTRLPADNYRLGVDVAVAQGGAGVVFLREGAGDVQTGEGILYRIILTPDGAYAIERQQGEETTKVVDFTANGAITPNASNRLEIERQGNTIRFNVNGQLLQDYEVGAGSFENRYGFVLTARSGQGQATFDNLRGEVLPTP